MRHKRSAIERTLLKLFLLFGTTVLVMGQSASLSDLKAKAESGDAKAQVEMGMAFALGNGTAVDDGVAASWFRKAAEQGDAEGERRLGEMYSAGRGVPKDDKQAVQWTQKAANQGDLHAAANLGAAYLDGLGVKKDQKIALLYTRQAADGGIAAARFRLGAMYANGIGTSRDAGQAVTWYTMAVQQGYVPAMNNLAWMLLKSDDPLTKDPKKALDLALQATSKDQKVPEYFATLGMAYYANHKYDEAADAQQKALALDPTNGSYKITFENYQRIAQFAKESASDGRLEVFGVKSGASPPKALSTPYPLFTGIEGTVVLWLVVTSEGKVADLRVARSLEPSADKAAMDAVRKWRFQPAMRNGEPVAVQINVEVTF